VGLIYEEEGLQDHEGYVVGVVEKETPGKGWKHWEELSMYVTPEPEARAGIKLSTVQAGCVCGWRSQRIHVPSSVIAEFAPWSVFIRDWLPSYLRPSPDRGEIFEESVLEHWRGHMRDVRSAIGKKAAE
jgi:hypothetical protein